MIASVLNPDAIVALLSLAIAWVAGVAWAAYRALSWVDRIRTWAYSDLSSSTSTEGIDQ